MTLLPPHVPHNGSPVTPQGFRKRVVYLEASALDDALIGRVVDSPEFADPLLRDQIDRMHDDLRCPGEELAAESRLSLVVDRLRFHLDHTVEAAPRSGPMLAADLRDVLDARVVPGVSLAEAARILHAHPAHLVRQFGRRFGLPPHRYLTGRRVDLARRLLLDGMPVARVARASGFHDQAHLSRHFGRILGTTPGRFARSRHRGTG